MSVAEPPHGREGPVLGEEERRKLVRALTEWAERHPEPDRPVLGFASSRFVSPRELANAVRADESEIGQQFLRSVRLILTEVPLNTYLASIDRSARVRWRFLRRVWMLLRRRFQKPDHQQPIGL